MTHQQTKGAEGPCREGEVMIERSIIGFLVVAAILAGLTSAASAACRWEWDCSRGYPCRQIQVCDGALDLPTIQPPGVSPIPPPTIRPIPTPTLPPLGTTQCRQAYLCDAFGRCAWQTVCR